METKINQMHHLWNGEQERNGSLYIINVTGTGFNLKLVIK